MKTGGGMHLEPLRRLIAALGGAHDHPLLDRAHRRSGRIALGFLKQRFVRYARGGGDWKPLQKATLRRRRQGQGSGRAEILRDTGILINALDVGAPGNLCQRTQTGIRVGFGGAARHPGGKATIRDIAVFHDQGEGHNPQRQIIAEPDAATQQAMAAQYAQALDELGKELEGK
jgi:hypothetical protein